MNPAPNPSVSAPPAEGAQAGPGEAGVGRRIHAIAASALLLVYLAVMSGHMTSMDGFLLHRQAYAWVFERSMNFRTPGWYWKGEPAHASKFGIGLSLAYLPGMLFASPLASLVPRSEERPKKPFAFYFEQLYDDPLYKTGGAWVHAVVTALAAYLVGRLMTALGSSRRASLWGMALYGLGSSAIVYSRGDFTQPLVGLCWLAALLGAVRFRQHGSAASILACAAATSYAILTRPFDGMLVAIAVLALVVPPDVSRWSLRALRPAFVVGLGVVAAVALTALVNWARTGDALATGYRFENAWSVPGLDRIAYVLAGPARGVLWELPAVVLLPLGAGALGLRQKRFEAVVLLSLCGVLLLNTASWKVWWGGWCWGLRLFLPALPVLAVVAGAGIDRLGPRMRTVLPAVLLLAGFACALPGVVTDPIAGFAKRTDGAPLAWSLEAFRPYGAWEFLNKVFPDHPRDLDFVDILWIRIAPATGYWSLVVPVVLLAGAVALAIWCARELRRDEAEAAIDAGTR